MEYREWIDSNKDQLANSWERMFVDNVLTRVSDLSWDSLEAQFPFRDGDGGQRYADFALSEGDHVRIILEVDGYDKRGRGTGMTAKEFVDWQRRQNALSDQGWSVLRFANRDVRDYPVRCAEHIALLLRQQRHAMKHHENLHRSILDLERRLEDSDKRIAEATSTYGKRLQKERQAAEAAKRDRARLEKELEKVREEMKLAERAPGLDTQESKRLQELKEEQEKEIEALGRVIQEQSQQIKAGEESQGTMRTTIWAFTILIIFVMVLLVYVLGGPNQSTPSDIPHWGEAERDHAGRDSITSEREAVEPTGLVGESCRSPASWTSARQFVGQRAAISGEVKGITHRSDLGGQPTWINVGAEFPNRDRLELVIWGRNRPAFDSEIRRLAVGDEICAIGTISEYRGVVQIELQNAAQLSVR